MSKHEWKVRNHPVGYVIVSGEREIARFVKQLCPESEIQKLIDAHNAILAALQPAPATTAKEGQAAGEWTTLSGGGLAWKESGNAISVDNLNLAILHNAALAAEQRKHDRELADYARKQVKALAAEREKAQAKSSMVRFKDVEKLREQLATALEALRLITTIRPDLVAKAALAKPEEGK